MTTSYFTSNTTEREKAHFYLHNQTYFVSLSHITMKHFIKHTYTYGKSSKLLNNRKVHIFHQNN